MLPAATSLGPVALAVADLAAALGFYRDVLGFQVARRSEDEIILCATGSPSAVLILSAAPGARRRPTAGLYHFALLLPTRADLARAVRHLIGAGAAIEGASDHGVSEAVYLHDPEGNGIELYADRPRERWPTRDGRLAMGTTALDLEDLLAQDARPWEGMPQGTGIGHVHLRVADLARSERFYAGVLGFQVTVRGYPGALFLSAGGYHHHIGLNIWAGTGIPPRDPQGPGLRYFTVRLPDRADALAARRRLQAAGAPVAEAGGPGGWLTQDPDGIGVLLAW